MILRNGTLRTYTTRANVTIICFYCGDDMPGRLSATTKAVCADCRAILMRINAWSQDDAFKLKQIVYMMSNSKHASKKTLV